MKVCPECSQIADEDRERCPWCGHALTDQNVFVLQRKVRSIHSPLSPRCTHCQAGPMKFIANDYGSYPVRSTYECQRCHRTVQTTNRVLTLIKASGRLVRFVLGD